MDIKIFKFDFERYCKTDESYSVALKVKVFKHIFSIQIPFRIDFTQNILIH